MHGKANIILILLDQCTMPLKAIMFDLCIQLLIT